MHRSLVLASFLAAGLIGPATPVPAEPFSSARPTCSAGGAALLGEVQLPDRRAGAEVWNVGPTWLDVFLGDDGQVGGNLSPEEHWTWPGGPPGARYVVIPGVVSPPPRPEPDPAGLLLLGMLAGGALVLVTMFLLAARGRRRASSTLEGERDEARAEAADLRERLADIAERARLSEPETV